MRNLIVIFLLLACGTVQAQVDTTVKPQVYTLVEKMPTYPGGDAALLAFLRKNITYPPMERDNDIQGKVVVKFVVDVDGKVTEPQIFKSVSPGLDKEALRVVSLLSDFEPGTQDGIPVKVYYNLPIFFLIDDGFYRSESGEYDFFEGMLKYKKTFSKALQSFKEKDYQAAEKGFKWVIKRYPDYYEGYLFSALCQMKIGNVTNACLLLDKAIQYGSKIAIVEKNNNCK